MPLAPCTVTSRATTCWCATRMGGHCSSISAPAISRGPLASPGSRFLRAPSHTSPPRPVTASRRGATADRFTSCARWRAPEAPGKSAVLESLARFGGSGPGRAAAVDLAARAWATAREHAASLEVPVAGRGHCRNGRFFAHRFPGFRPAALEAKAHRPGAAARTPSRTGPAGSEGPVPGPQAGAHQRRLLGGEPHDDRRGVCGKRLRVLQEQVLHPRT
jgi:hypothetical protein